MFIYSTRRGLFPLNYKRKIAVIAKPALASMALALKHKNIDSSLSFRMTLKLGYCHSDLVEKSMLLILTLKP